MFLGVLLMLGWLFLLARILTILIVILTVLIIMTVGQKRMKITNNFLLTQISKLW